MKRISALLFLIALFVSSCSFLQKPPQEVVDEGFEQYWDVKRMSSQFSVDAVVSEIGPDGQPRNVNVGLEMAGNGDSSNEKSPLGEVKFVIKVKAPEGTGKGEVTMRTVDKKLFLKLANLELPGEAGVSVKNQLSSILDKWFSYNLGEGGFFDKLTEEQSGLQENFRSSKFFVNAVYEGEEAVSGAGARRYRVELNKDAIKGFILELGKLGSRERMQGEDEAISESLKDMEFSGVVLVGDDDIFHGLRGTLTMRPKDSANSSFDFDYKAWDYGKKVEITAPESSQEFNSLMLLPIYSVFQSLGGPVSAGTLGTSSSAGASIDSPLGKEQVNQ